MATRIVIKNSTVEGKVPSTSDLSNAELALNLADKKLYSKDANGNIFEIGASDGANVPGGDDRPASGNEEGDLFFDTSTNTLLYWDGGQWVPIGGDEALALNDLSDVEVDPVSNGQVLSYQDGSWVPVSPASLAVDVDLGYTAAADGGTVTNTAGDDAALPLADGSNAGLMAPADFTKLDGIEDGAQVNPDLDGYLQSGDDVSELVNDAGYITEADVPVSSGGDEPVGSTHGDLWVDTSECPPVLKIYVDEAQCPGEGGWQIEGGAPKPIEPTPDDGNSSISPTPSGSGTEGDPYVLTAKTVNYGGTTTSTETISFSNQKPGAFVQFVDQNEGANGSRFSRPLGVIGEDGTWTGQLKFADSPATTDDTTYTGLLKIGSSSIYYSWDVTSETAVIPPPVITQNPVISSATGYINDLITVDTRAAVTGATFTSSAWLKDGVVIPGETSTSSYTPSAAGTYMFREVFTGDDGSTVNVDSNEVEAEIDPTKPTATMHGLRFDGERQTRVYKTMGQDHRTDEWTVSFWVKAHSKYTPVFCARTGNVTRELIRVDEDKIVYVGNTANNHTRAAPTAGSILLQPKHQVVLMFI